MAKFIPPGFDADAARAGILNAMGFGEPTRTDDKATFFFPKTRTSATNTKVDQDAVPFDPDVAVTVGDSHAKLQVSCAVEYTDASEMPETFGGVRASRIKITLLDAEYQQIKGFSFVVAGGDKYVHDSTEPPVALGTIDVWTVHCTAEDET